MVLAGSEIHLFQSRIHDLERDLESAKVVYVAADESLDRLRDELRLTQEEVVTNDIELKDAQESVEKLSAGRGYALEEFVRMIQARDELKDKLTDTKLQRDKAATVWADATRVHTELKSKIRSMSDKLKTAEKTSAQLRDQVTTVRNQHKQLVLERDQSLSERDIALRREATPHRIHRIWRWIPLPRKRTRISSPGDPGEVDDDGGVGPGGDLRGVVDDVSGQTGAKSKVVRHSGSSKPGPKTASSTKGSANAEPAAGSSKFLSKVKSKNGSTAKVASKVGSGVTASSKAGSVAPRTGSTAKPSSKMGLTTGSAAIASSK
ncbi:hypothetical protein PInf_002650 [Phytophthora infestans]|nr:hypothetical protein PInf_002650 [Phytophthora infestans]